MRCRNSSRQSQKSGYPSLSGEKHRGNLRHRLPVLASAYRQQDLNKGLETELGKQPCNGNRKDTSEELVRSKVERCKVVADEAVVVKK